MITDSAKQIPAKDAWVAEAYCWLVATQGKPANAQEEKNLKEFADAMYDHHVESADEYEKLTPKEAIEEEISRSQ